MKGDLRFVVPALAGSGFIPPKGGTTNVSRRSMQYPGERGATRYLADASGWDSKANRHQTTPLSYLE